MKQQRIRAPHSRSGFTLVELLVVIGLIAIIFGFGVNALSNYATRQSFQTALIDVRDGVIETRQRTLASMEDTHYGVHVDTSVVTLFEGDTFSSSDPDNILISLPNGITATANLTGGVTSATFTRLTGLPSATGEIVLTDERNNTTATVTIYASGLVE